MYQFEKYSQKLPRSFVKFLRYLYLSFLDIKDQFEGKSKGLIPPRSLHYIGGGDFQTIGDNFIQHFINVGNLDPSETILDIGCGTGRMAIPLMKYLSPSGRYLGFDISEKAIAWCQRTITKQNPNFSFHFANIRNTEYNPNGKLSAIDYRFPCEDNTIDFAFATSVFTHMRRDEVTHYIRELHRTLKPTGRAMLSFFILDEENDHLMHNENAMLKFNHEIDGYYTVDPKTPERAIAYRVETVNSIISNTGLHFRQPILYGSWSGRASMLDTQDFVILTKTKIGK